MIVSDLNELSDALVEIRKNHGNVKIVTEIPNDQHKTVPQERFLVIKIMTSRLISEEDKVCLLVC